MNEIDAESRPHLSATDMAAYVEGRLSAARRGEVEAHLSTCASCVDEVMDLRAILDPRSHRRRATRWAIPLAAAAALILLVAVPSMSPEDSVLHRDRPATPVSPALLPTGRTGPSPVFSWTRVEEADRYRLSLFDTAGAVVWSSRTGDTAVSLPDSIVLEPGATYLWQVEGRVGFDRWVASDLARIEILP